MNEKDYKHMKHKGTTKILTSSVSERSTRLVTKTKKTIDKMVSEGIPLTADKIALYAGCSKSFVYKNKEIRDYIEKTGQKPAVGKKVYSSLDNANKRIRELENQNMNLILENARLYNELALVLNKYSNLIELNIKHKEETIRRINENVKNKTDSKLSEE